MMNVRIVPLLSAFVLLIIPSSTHGQCATPEGCKNEEGYQACVGPDQSQTCLWEDCYVYQELCQLSDCCDHDCCFGGITEEDQLSTDQFAPDLAVTPAGTHAASARLRVDRGRSETVKSCRGLVVASADYPWGAPRIITIE